MNIKEVRITQIPDGKQHFPCACKGWIVELFPGVRFFKPANRSHYSDCYKKSL